MCPAFWVGCLDTAEKRCRSSSTASLCPRRNLSVCAQESVYLAVSQAHLAGHQIPPSLDRLRSLRVIFTARGHGKAQVQRVSGLVTMALPHLLFFFFFQRWCPWDFDKRNLGCAPERLCDDVQLSAFVGWEAAPPRPVLVGTRAAFQLWDGSSLVTLVDI